MVQFDHIARRFPDFDLELHHAIRQGELVSILGPSGSGKTTALRLIAGFEHPDNGKILIAGQDVTHMPPAQRRVGYVFQDFTLFPHMTVEQNIAYGLKVRGWSKQARTTKVSELLERVNLIGYGKRAVQTLSGGERQRVAIARAIAVDPVLLLLDEPFSSIDEVLRQELRDQIVLLQRQLGITAIFVTHSCQEALAISHRVAVLRHGRIEQYDTPERIYRTPTNRFVASFVGTANYLPDKDGNPAMLRPEQIRILPTTTATPATPQEITSTAHVERRRFLGNGYELFCIAGTQHCTVLSAQPFDTGQRITLAYTPQEGIPLLP